MFIFIYLHLITIIVYNHNIYWRGLHQGNVLQ
nr:MAG TPA: Iron/manganese superoxide dismutase [Caudoviricetes sp.]